MFEKEHVSCRLEKIEHLKMQKDDCEIALIKSTWEISPFTAQLATELDEFVRATLFTMTDAEVTSRLAGATFRLTRPPQEIVVRMAPDQTQGSFTITEAKVGPFYARRSLKSSAWRLLFVATFSPATEHQLAQVVDSITKTRYLTFADAQADLFVEVSKEEKRARKGAATPAHAAAAAATH